jgi:N-acetyl-anhydromuramyl-L-alanine amidase AmpD
MVVIHATFNTASDENEAHYAEHRSDQVSAHFYNDGDSVIQALDTDLIAYGCYPIGNSRSVQFELVGLDWDHDPPGPGAVSDATMREVAPIVARVCRQYGIPMRKVGPAELRAGVAGICGHADVTLAWGRATTWIPAGVPVGEVPVLPGGSAAIIEQGRRHAQR